jgi:catalase
MLTPAEAIDQLRAPFDPPPGYRSAHAKGAFYAGTFVATPEAAALCRAEHLGGTEVPLLVRWSNGAGTTRYPDGKADIRGMALKFRPGAGDTDLLGQTSPRFPTDDPAVFVAMAEPAVHQWKLPLYMARHPSTIAPLLAGMRGGALPSPVSYAEIPYYPIHAYGWLDANGDRTWVRYVFRPLATDADRLPQEFSGPDRLRDEIVARLARGPVEFDLHVQVAGAADDPHSSVSVWKDPRDFVAGRITVTEPVADPEADGSVVVFDPTRVIDGIELSDDPILRFRGEAYGESVSRRQGEGHAQERAAGG